MELTLTPELRDSIQREMDRGHFTTPTEVLKNALALLRAEEEHVTSLGKTLNAKLEKSFAAAKRGEVISGDDFESELNAWRAGVSCRDIG